MLWKSRCWCYINWHDFTSTFLHETTQVRQAIERGIHFEIVYSPAIRDNTQRRYIISNAMELVHVSKGKNIIISSEAGHQMDLRGPYDVANLGNLFGMKEEQCKAAVSGNVRAVLYHAEARRSTEKSTISGCLISAGKVRCGKWERKEQLEMEKEEEMLMKLSLHQGKGVRMMRKIHPKRNTSHWSSMLSTQLMASWRLTV